MKDIVLYIKPVMCVLCFYVFFRSRSGVHRVSEGRQSDAGGSALGGALLLHVAATGTGQSGDQLSFMV